MYKPGYGFPGISRKTRKMNDTPLSVAELRKKYPFPWNHQMYANGLLQVLDVNGVEIPILTMVSFMTTITTIINQTEQKA